MAVTIGRSAWVDDDGSGTTGTVLNNAVKTSLYDQIDAALALLLPLAGGTITGLLTVSAYGAHTISSGGAGTQSLTVTNTTNGAASTAKVQVSCGANVYLEAYPAAFTTADRKVASGALLEVEQAGGLSIAASSGSGALRFYAGGVTRRMGISTAGVVTLDAYTATTFAAGDKYLVVDASGNVHRSAIGPAS